MPATDTTTFRSLFQFPAPQPEPNRQEQREQRRAERYLRRLAKRVNLQVSKSRASGDWTLRSAPRAILFSQQLDQLQTLLELMEEAQR
jgi:hypothetical protein